MGRNSNCMYSGHEFMLKVCLFRMLSKYVFIRELRMKTIVQLNTQNAQLTTDLCPFDNFCICLHFKKSKVNLLAKEQGMNPDRHLKFSILVLALLVTLGTTGYMVIEGWRFLDSLYMTIITLATV